MNMENLRYLTKELSQLEEFVKNSTAYFDDIVEHVENKLIVLRRFATQNGIPLHVDAYTLVLKYHEEPEYEEEYSSSYYEEPEDSSYYEDSYYYEEDSSYDEDDEGSGDYN